MFSLLGRPRGIAAFTSMIAIVAASEAHAQEAFVSFDIRAQPLSAALLEFSRQADIPVGVDPALVNGKSAPAVQGSMAPTEALNRLLAGSGLVATRRPEGGFVLAEAPTRLGAVDQTPRETAYGEIVVTGTRIKGVADQFSHVTRIGRDDMDIAGAATVADVLDTLPQNFGGGVTPDTVNAGTIDGTFGGVSFNLRGLGNEATLVLLNGRRPAPGGVETFVDVSAIPVSAIERIEVLPDGASAIYGTDAVAGVVNVITRDDFSGGETRLSVSGVEGGAEAVVLGQTLGWSSERAHGLLTYQYLDQNELDQNDKDFSRGHRPDPHWLLPASKSHSVLASGGVVMTPRASLDLDLSYSLRESAGAASSQTLGLNLAFQEAEVEQYGASGGLRVDLDGDWASDVSLTYSRSTFYNITATNAGDVIVSDAANEIASIDVSLGGPLFHINDEPVELVVGAHTRTESAEFFAVSSSGLTNGIDEGRRVASSFFEVYAPLVGRGAGAPGMRRLAFTAAGRYDNYDDVGSSFDPRLGLTWSPVEGLHVRGTWGTSFRAPKLAQLLDSYSANLGIYDDPAAPDGESVALVIAGTRANLSPEQAETWTAGFDFEPVWLRGFRLRATYFNVAYNDRVGFPTFNFTGDFHFADFTGIPVRGLSAAEIQDLVDNVTVAFVNLGDFFPIGPLALADVEVLLDGRLQNLSKSTVEGVDFEASYGAGDWLFFLNGSHLSEFTQQASPTTPVVELLNTFGNPVDLRLRGGMSWSTERMAAALFVNHVAAYTDDESTDPTFGVDAWTTLDASLRLNLARAADRGTSLTLTLNNALDEDPPRIGPSVLRAANFDAANTDPSGRRVGMLLSKRW